MEFKTYVNESFVEAAIYEEGMDMEGVRMREHEKEDGHPKIGDMIVKGDGPGYFFLLKKSLFDDNYKEVEDNSGLVGFDKVIIALKEGKKASRLGWNGKNMFIFLTKGRTIANDGERSFKHFEDLPDVTLADHIDMRDAHGNYISGWLASQTDMLAEDWAVFE